MISHRVRKVAIIIILLNLYGCGVYETVFSCSFELPHSNDS